MKSSVKIGCAILALLCFLGIKIKVLAATPAEEQAAAHQAQAAAAARAHQAQAAAAAGAARQAQAAAAARAHQAQAAAAAGAARQAQAAAAARAHQAQAAVAARAHQAQAAAASKAHQVQAAAAARAQQAKAQAAATAEVTAGRAHEAASQRAQQAAEKAKQANAQAAVKAHSEKVQQEAARKAEHESKNAKQTAAHKAEQPTASSKAASSGAPTAKTKPNQINSAVWAPVIAKANPGERQKAQGYERNLKAHLIAENRPPANLEKIRSAGERNYFNNYRTTIRNRPIVINRQNTFVSPVQPSAYPAWYQSDPNWVYSNGFTLANQAVGPQWLNWGWRPFYGPPPSGFICPAAYYPTPWVYLPAYNCWTQPGTMECIPAGPMYGYAQPITVDVIEPYPVSGGNEWINVTHMYNAYYYPDSHRWGYKDQRGHFIWLRDKALREAEKRHGDHEGERHDHGRAERKEEHSHHQEHEGDRR